MSNTSARDLTIKLLKVIGSPFEPKGEVSIDVAESQELYLFAARNKISLLYLDALSRYGKLNELKAKYEEEQADYQNFLAGLARVSEVLHNWAGEHVIVKTLRPYPAVPSDVDVVILNGPGLKTAIEVLLKADYTPLLSHLIDGVSFTGEEGYARAAEILTRPTWYKAHVSPTGSTFIDDEYGIHIDLQSNMAVSYVTYLDKDSFENYLSSMDMPDGHRINALVPELELVSVIAHSVIERSYRLGEFYTFLHQLAKMDEQHVGLLISLAKANKFERALKAFATLTVELHKAVFNSIPPKVQFILTKIGFNPREARKLAANNFHTPHRYCLSTIAGVFFEKMGEKKFRKGIGTQLVKMLNPKVTRLVISELLGTEKEE